MRLNDHKIERLKDAAAESAAEQAKMAEGPTLPETLAEIPDDWLDAERERAENAAGHPIRTAEFVLYVSYLTDAYKEENNRMLREGRQMD